MKLRSSHLVAAVLVVIGALIAAAVLRERGPGPETQATDSTDDFLAQVGKIRETGAGSSAKTGIVPSADHDMTKLGKLEFSESPVEMGAIPKTGKTEKRIEVRNVGAGPIDITEIRTSCLCTQGGFERGMVGADGQRLTRIGPGQAESLLITVDPMRMHGFEAHKVLTLVTNDPITYQYELQVNSHVEPEFSVEPDVIDFGKVDRGAPAEARAIIRQLADEPFDVTGVELDSSPNKSGVTPLEVVTIELGKRPESDWTKPGHAEWDLVARLLPSAEPGVIRETIILSTTAPRIPKADFSITGEVESFFTMDSANLGVRETVAPGQARVAKVTISARAPITVSDAQVTGEGLTVETVPQADPSKVDLYLSVAPNATAGLKNETVTFSVTGEGKTEQQSMRAYVSVQSAAAAN